MKNSTLKNLMTKIFPEGSIPIVPPLATALLSICQHCKIEGEENEIQLEKQEIIRHRRRIKR